MRARIIPVLLIRDGGLYKTINFKDGVYIGDPINAIRLFNDMEVDEIIVLDISATRLRRGPDFDLIRSIASEAFMPFCYGGGITEIDEIREIFNIGVEKIVINHSALGDPEILSKSASEFGSQSIVGSLDISTTLFNKPTVYDYVRGKQSGINPVQYVQQMEDAGVGELFINSVENDGVMKGYDLDLINKLCGAVSIPAIVCGGAGSLDDMKDALDAGADAVAAGSIFVFQGKQKGVLINYPSQVVLEEKFGPL